MIRRFGGVGGDGVQILPNSTQNRIEGNFIGTDLGGTLDEGNFHGVQIFASTNTIGGSSADKRNLISGNDGDGVEINGLSGTTSFNRVEGNLIGTKKDGTTALGNSGNGVATLTVSNSTFSGNSIAFNGNDGVTMDAAFNSNNANGNLVLGNSIFSNSFSGIDLGRDGITTNDLGDGDAGANSLQNFPVLTSAKTSRKGTTIKGTLNSTPNKAFLVQFFSNASGDEGQKPIGQTGVSTDASGNSSFTFKPTQKVPRGQKITATATDTGGKNTSEFSASKKVVRP